MKNYASQYAAAKSLPFTSAQMALDCVSASFSTAFGNVPPNPKAIAELMQRGHKAEADALRKIMYVCQHVDTGGKAAAGSKRKGNPKKPSRKKRSRFRLYRTSVVRRVKNMADEVLKQKVEFLLKCPYVGLILDEGNNFKRSCPIYVAVIACDREFNCKIMFVGQADCEGKKDGASIHALTRKIFEDAGMIEVYKKIVAAGTDGASVMRSSAEFRGKWNRTNLCLMLGYINLIQYYVGVNFVSN